MKWRALRSSTCSRHKSEKISKLIAVLFYSLNVVFIWRGHSLFYIRANKILIMALCEPIGMTVSKTVAYWMCFMIRSET